jgi:hypothetical protein
VIQTPRIVYRARDDATPEREACALAAAYRLVLSAKEKGHIADTNDPDDVKGWSAIDFHASNDSTV